MFKLIVRFRSSRSGATAVEYAILSTSIALVIVAAVGFLGTQLNSTYLAIAASFQ